MKLIYLVFILYASQFYAQQQSEFKQYADTINGFSMKIPQQYVIKDKSSTHFYVAKELDDFKFDFSVQSKTMILDDLYFSDLPQFKKLDLADTLLSIAYIKCYFSLNARGNRGEAYGRVDSLFQWTINNEINIIEIHRTQVIDIYDGSFEYNKAGPLFIAELVTAKGKTFLTYDFYGYIKEEDYDICKNIISSIKIIE